MEHSFSYLDLQGISSNKPTQVAAHTLCSPNTVCFLCTGPLTAACPAALCRSLLLSAAPLQLVLEYDRGPGWSLRLGSVEEVDQVIGHIGRCLQLICPAGSPV